MNRLRHLAIASDDPEATAAFYEAAFGFERVGELDAGNPLAEGVLLSDGTLNLAVLRFKTDQIGRGLDFVGPHHFGILVDDEAVVTARLLELGATPLDVGDQDEHGDAGFERKFKAPDGTVFDISSHPWLGVTD
jgi:catechol 2,3-dioxygenase-like lactoylglutathione lyase family enzyme